MINHRCISQKSLINVRKWLLEAGDGLSSPIYDPSSKFNRNFKQKPHLNKINKRKRFNNQNFYSKSTSIIDWFYEYIKNIFTIYDENPLKSNEQIHDSTIDETNPSIMTCSTCYFENVKTYNSRIQSRLKKNKSNLDLQSKTNPKIMVTTATSSCNLNISQSIILRSSKSTQTNHNEQQSTIYPLYCFSVKDGQILSLQFSSTSNSTIIPIVKEVISSSSPFAINKKKSEYCNPPINSSISLFTNDIHSYFSYQPTITSIPSSHSNIISLKTTENFKGDNTSHFDKHNCLTERYHSSNTGKNYPVNCHRSSSTNTDVPEIVFAENTCQLIKQSWLSSIPDQQANF